MGPYNFIDLKMLQALADTHLSILSIYLYIHVYIQTSSSNAGVFCYHWNVLWLRMFISTDSLQNSKGRFKCAAINNVINSKSPFRVQHFKLLTFSLRLVLKQCSLHIFSSLLLGTAYSVDDIANYHFLKRNVKLIFLMISNMSGKAEGSDWNQEIARSVRKSQDTNDKQTCHSRVMVSRLKHIMH